MESSKKSSYITLLSLKKYLKILCTTFVVTVIIKADEV